MPAIKYLKNKTAGKLVRPQSQKYPTGLTDNRLLVQVTVVGGGAAGAIGSGGGGGYVTTANVGVPQGTHTITIGGGGSSLAFSGTISASQNGNPTSFGTMLSSAGGERPAGYFTAGGNGGSGGGGAGPYKGIGGDGGTNGSNGATSVVLVEGSAIAGGIGQGTTTYEFGDSSRTLYGGGGGAGVYNDTMPPSSGSQGTAGSGGAGGGGAGSKTSAGGNGSPNTGGGGGGGCRASGNYSDGYASGQGGSGKVIVRYPGPQAATGGSYTSAGGYSYHTFTGDGTFTPTGSGPDYFIN